MFGTTRSTRVMLTVIIKEILVPCGQRVPSYLMPNRLVDRAHFRAQMSSFTPH